MLTAESAGTTPSVFQEQLTHVTSTIDLLHIVTVEDPLQDKETRIS